MMWSTVLGSTSERAFRGPAHLFLNLSRTATMSELVTMPSGFVQGTTVQLPTTSPQTLFLRDMGVE